MMNTAKSTLLLWMSVFVLLLLAEKVLAVELPDFTELVEINGPVVVNISTRQKTKVRNGNPSPRYNIPEFPQDSPFDDLFRHFFGDPGLGGNDEYEEALKPRSLGSGFIIDSSGYILTNNHVIEGAEEIIVRLSDRRELKAELVGGDKRSDIALLKVKAKNLPVVNIGNTENLKVGEWVMAIGSPFGFDHSVSVGVISALGRSLPSESYVPFIQTDVAINPGNSGGPLFNLKGEVIGINSQIYSRTGGFMGLSFAIPIDVAIDVIAQLKEKGHVSRGWLGVLVQDVTRELAESFGMGKPSGALVAKVLSGSPSDRAGLEAGDIIIEYNGKKVIYSSDLPPLVGRTPVDSVAQLKLIRNGKSRILEVTIGRLPEEQKISGLIEPGKVKTDRIGIVVTELTDKQREQFDLDVTGVVVTEVERGPAQEAGIRAGDIIIKFNNVSISSVKQFKSLIKKADSGKSVPILVQRREGPTFLALRIPKDD